MSLIREYESKLPPELLAKYRRTFDQFDRDGGGDVDVRELGVMFRALRQFPQERELERMVSDVDDDGSGTIDFNEFCGLMLRLSRSKTMPRWLKAAIDPQPAAAVAPGGPPPATPVSGGGEEEHPDGGLLVDADGRLDLSGRLPSEELQLMASDLLSAAAHVRALVLSANALTNAGLIHLAAALTRNRSISTLALCGCGLHDAEAAALSKMLSDNVALSDIDLADNGLTDAGVATLAEVLRGSNRSVRLLGLKGNASITPTAAASLDPLLLRNRLAGVVAQQMPELMLCNARLEPLHAPAIRSALLNAAEGLRQGMPPGASVLPTSIDLSENPRLGDAGVRGIFGVRPDIADESAASLPPALQPSGLRKKVLSVGAAIVAAGPHGGGSRRVSAAATPPLVGPLVHRLLSRTTQLALDGVGIGDEGVRAFAEALGAGELAQLRELSLCRNSMGADARVLGHLGAVLAENCVGIREFRLSRCARLIDESACALFSNWLPTVACAHSKLARAAPGVGARVVEPLHLFVGGTRAGDGACAVLAASLGAGLCLGTLSLGTHVGDLGASSLGHALGQGGVVGVLQLGDRIADDGAVDLADGVRESKWLRRLIMGGALLETVAAGEAGTKPRAVDGLGEEPYRVNTGGDEEQDEAEDDGLPEEGAWEIDAAGLAEWVAARLELVSALASGRRLPQMPSGFSANPQMGEAAALAIGDCVRDNSTLRRLDLLGCAGLGDSGVGAIVARLAFNSSLRTITAAGCGVAEAERAADVSARLTGGAPRTPSGNAPTGPPKPKLDGRSVAVRALRQTLKTNYALAEVRLFGAAEERRSSFANSRELLELAAILHANVEKGAWRIEEAKHDAMLSEWQWVFRELAPGGPDLPPEQWGASEVRKFVANAGLAQYAEAVGANCGNGSKLLGLTVEHLGQLGVRDFAHQKLLVDRIRSLHLAFAKQAEVRSARGTWELLTRALAVQTAAEARAAEEEAQEAAEQALSPVVGRSGRGAPKANYPIGGLPKEIFRRTELPPSQLPPRGVPAKQLPYVPPRLAPITGMPKRYTERKKWEPPPELQARTTSPHRRPNAGAVLRSVSHLGGPQPHPAIAALQALVLHGGGRFAGGGQRPARGQHGLPDPMSPGGGLEVHVKTLVLPLDVRPNLLI